MFNVFGVQHSCLHVKWLEVIEVHDFIFPLDRSLSVGVVLTQVTVVHRSLLERQSQQDQSEDQLLAELQYKLCPLLLRDSYS